MTARRSGIALLLALGATAACQSATDDKTGPSGASGASGPPVVRGVVLPPTPSDVVALEVTVADPGGAAVRLVMSVSLDGGASWRPARHPTDPGNLVSSPDGTKHVVDWDSVQDVGFHHPRAARLRVAAEGPGGLGPAIEVDTPPIDNLRARARRIHSYVINYGEWPEASVTFAKKHDLVIAHPTVSDLHREFVADLQQGNDPADPADDVIVLCYVSVGEDVRAINVSDDDARVDPRFRGDGSGPRIDPRGPEPESSSLMDIAPEGDPSNGGTGWASFYLDDNSVYLSPTHTGDGIPDRNSLFGGFFVNAGDPSWFPVVDSNLLDSPDHAAGLREVLTASYGRSLDCDGVFMDTIDTAGPNSYTNEESLNLSKFEWTAPGMAKFIAHLREVYPDRLIMQNRGLFYFDPRKPHFQFTTRGSIDFGFFESYRLDSNQFDPGIYPDNRWNFAPKLMAEANRPDGFTVLSMGYAEGTQLPGAADTLVGKGNVGFDSFLEDIRVAQEVAGFRHYLTNEEVSLVNSFVHDHSNWEDHTPPAWTSTWNDHDHESPGIPEEATPRIGIQEVVPGSRSLTVRWDVALDMNRVGYALYYQQPPFDFAADPDLARATRVVLSPAMPAAYKQGIGPRTYPYEAQLEGLEPLSVYHLVIRAFDASAARNEDKNQVVLTGVPFE